MQRRVGAVLVALFTLAVFTSPCLSGAGSEGPGEITLDCERWWAQWRAGHTNAPVPQQCQISDDLNPIGGLGGTEDPGTTSTDESGSFFRRAILDRIGAVLESVLGQ